MVSDESKNFGVIEPAKEVEVLYYHQVGEFKKYLDQIEAQKSDQTNPKELFLNTKRFENSNDQKDLNLSLAKAKREI